MRILSILAVAAALAGQARAVSLYTNSTAFYAALGSTPSRLEDFADASDGQVFTDGATFGDLAFGPSNLTFGASMLDITNLYESISGLTLGADHRANARDGDGAAAVYFYGGEGTRVTFAHPVFAAGVFFTVNLNSGLFGIVTSEGSVENDSSSLESRALSDHLVFAGLISDHAFSSVTIYSTGQTADYNIAAIASVSEVPEPSTGAFAGLLALLAAVGGRSLIRRRPRRLAAR